MQLERAREAVGAGAPRVEKLRAFYNHPGFDPVAISSLSLPTVMPEAEVTVRSSRSTETAGSPAIRRMSPPCPWA